MTGTKTTHRYITPGSHNLQVPTHNEFNRYTSNRILNSDFSTVYPNGLAVDEVARAIKWTYSNENKRNMKWNLKRKEK